MDLEAIIAEKYRALGEELSEATRRKWAATEAKALGRGGATRVSRATGISLPTIRKGLRELKQGTRLAPGHTRRRGGGRKPLSKQDASLLRDLRKLVSPATRGSPTSALRWTSKSTSHLAEALGQQGHAISARTVAHLLHELGYSLQANRKTEEGKQHPDRDAQFGHIAAEVERFQAKGQPVISVDAKKKELVGPFRQGGREWERKGHPRRVLVHDFIDDGEGKAIPYGVYDMSDNTGWVSVGLDHDTPAFAVATIRHWWQRMGRHRYPRARELLVTADAGGSNSARARLWKAELQRLANDTGLSITVCHFPPGTSKWNKIEHRMFCHITENWRGRPLVSHEVVVNLIAATTTRQGLHVGSELDKRPYPLGIKVTDDQMAALNLQRADFHGEWNYTIHPN
jgi:transposase